jgi:hypothetical protein
LRQTTNVNKRELLYKLVDVPKGAPKNFWGKEMKFLNSLLKDFPDMEFWEKTKVNKVESLILYKGKGTKIIAEQYKRYLFQPEFKNFEINLGDKAGEDYNNNTKPKTIKQFLK